MTRITTFLMFSGERHGNAEEAIDFYVAQFANSHVDRIERYGPEDKETQGTVKFATFTLNGQHFKAIDSAAPHAFNFTPSISLFVECTSEEEMSRLFCALSEAGEVLMPLDNYGFSRRFGWTNDRYGVSWQLNLA
ncbi:MAG TPA: VOC family protein [Gammaproteobacteria bacterium]|nr:VOC family protein [Gammaproteobacteria bacterium]